MDLFSWLGQWAFAPTQWLVIGLAIILAIFRHTQSVDLKSINLLKG